MARAGVADTPAKGAQAPSTPDRRRWLPISRGAARRALVSLRLQLLALFAMATLVPLAVSLIQVRDDRVAAERQAFAQAAAEARVAADNVGDLLGRGRRVAQTFSSLPGFWDATDEQRDQILAAFAAGQPTFNGLVYATPDLMEHGASDHVPDAARADFSARAHFLEAAATGQLAVSQEVLHSLVNGSTILAATIPLREQAPPARAGFLGVGLKLDQLPAVWADLPLPTGSGVLLVDTRSGRILAGSGAEAARVNGLIDPAHLERIRGGEPAFRVTSQHGPERLRAWAPVADTPWVAVTDIPPSAVLGPINAAAATRSLEYVALGASTLALLALLWWRLSGRLRALETAARRWSRQEWQYRTGLAGADELSHLGATFDHMADQLQAAVGRLEDALQRAREGEERVRAVLDSVTDGIVGLDRAGRTSFVNPAGARLLGHQAGELVGQPFHDLVHRSSGDAGQCPGGECQFSECHDGCQVAGETFWRRDGTSFPAEYASAPIRSQGAITGTVVAFKDVTARKRAEEELRESEERYRALVELSPDAIAVQARGAFAYVNSAGARLLGAATPEEVIGRPVLEFVPPDTRELVQSRIQQAQGEHGTTLQEMRLVRLDGRVIDIEVRGRGIIYQGAPATQIVLRDVTQRRAVEKMKDEFVSVVSHELRTPLTSIRGSLGLLAGGLLGPLPEKGQRMLEIAVNNADRLIRLINDILDIERMESGKISMRKQACDAADLLGQAGDTMRPMAERAGVRLTVAPTSARLWADPDRLLQALTNLLSNAIKFSPPGTTVRLSAERQGGELVVRVADQGRGIPADKLESIFERFQQVDASDSREKGGTGLGLAICRSIVQQHGGRIWVASALGEGSTFSCSLPVVEDAAPVFREDGGGPIVLLCDDEPPVLEVVGSMLAERGYRVVGVTSGAQAVAEAAERQPAAILLDLLMPGLSGWETLAALKERPETRHIPVIILSVVPPEPGELARTAARAWLGKPLDPEALFRALARAIGQPGERPRVLVVEDDLDLARVLAEQFERHGLRTYHAAFGGQAIELAQRVDPDLLLLDLGLPDGDGSAVVDWLRRHDRLGRVPLVVYTARDLDPLERDRLRLGPTQFLTKARVRPEELEQRVLALLERVLPRPEGVVQ